MLIFRYVLCATLALAALGSFAVRADDATIDTSFNPSGVDPGWRRAYDNVQPTANQVIVSAARAPDGGYVLAGSVDGGAAGSLIFLAKFRPDGNYDSSFGGTAGTGNAGSGRVLKDAFLTSVTDMTIDAQGRIVVVGEKPGMLGQSDFGVVRFNPNGTDDTSFSGDGSTYIGFDLDTAHGRAKDEPTSVTTAPDGSVYVAGRVEDITTVGGIATERVGVAKLMPDGDNTNTGYGTLSFGRQLFQCTYGCENVFDVRIVYDAPRNRLVVGGDFSLSPSDSDWFITIQTFGAEPYESTTGYPIDFGGSSGQQQGYMDRLAVQVDGKIVALGYAYDTNAELVPVVLRVEDNAYSEDASFGNVLGRGIMLPGTVGGRYFALAIDSSSRMVLAGYYPGGRDVGLVTRLMPNGAVDPGFNGDTVPSTFSATTSNGMNLAKATLFTRVFLDGGRPVLAGIATDSATTYTDTTDHHALESDRLFANGFQ